MPFAPVPDAIPGPDGSFHLSWRIKNADESRIYLSYDFTNDPEEVGWYYKNTQMGQSECPDYETAVKYLKEMYEEQENAY